MSANTARTALAAADPVMAGIIERIGELSIAERNRRRALPPVDAYGMLLRTVIGQQVSVKAAAAIYKRVLELFGGTTPAPAALLEVEPERLREAGLSGRKVEYVRDLAAHVVSGELELDRLEQMSDDEVAAEITAIRGFGEWSAQVFLMFHLERPDVLPVGDLGIRRAVQVEYGLDELPQRDQLLEIGRALAPAPHPRQRLPLGNAAQRARVSAERQLPHNYGTLAAARRVEPVRVRRLALAAMGSLISFEEASELAEARGEEAIGAIVERAWQVRTENFGDSTDMCSLVNAKSGGCAEDCGFCAQSRYAEADTPMHAMMEPEQILEHAKAAEAAGAHRFCMVTQGQGLSKRDFEKIVEGAKLVAEHTNLKRCASIGHISEARAERLADAGIQRVHHNVETARSYYEEVTTTVRYEGRMRTIDAVEKAGMETCVGGILNLGESPRQRVEMAFELSEIDPTSVPINLLNPRSGTKFGDRELMDPWEVVKWVAIFRLIIPGALFRLCGGRVENLGELQPLAVKAGLNGVMMGNFLTTLGAEPADDRAMFEELGLNVARQDDNGANPRPDNRSGWLDGETPQTPIDELIDSQAEANFWDPSTQLRVIKKKGAPPAYPERPSQRADPPRTPTPPAGATSE